MFLVKVSAEHMPPSCWGRYVRVAVLEVEEGVQSVKMISTRARGVIRIVHQWRKCRVGTTERAADSRAIATANAMAAALNAIKTEVDTHRAAAAS